jgi:hypothetical protein
VGAVDNQLAQLRNTFVKTFENAFLNTVLTSANINTYACPLPWTNSSAIVRTDLAEAMYLVSNSDADTTNGTGTQKFQFVPDTLVISQRTATDFLESADIAKVFVGGDLASENLQYKGTMPRQFFGLDVVKSWRLPTTQALVLQRNVCGFISDEQALEVTDMYEIRQRQQFRWDATRISAIGLDQPRAICLLTNVH